MTRYLVVTTCNRAQWQQYGRRMVETFRQHWPSDIDLLVYGEGFGESDIHDAAPWLVEFKRHHKGPRYNGGPDGRDYRRDVVRFAHKVAAIGAAADIECDVLIWLDADVVTHAPVTAEWLEELFPASATIAWLDRAGTYPECGCLMFRMPAARKVIERVIGMYQSGLIFNLAEWHDSYVFQHVVTTMVAQGKVTAHSLSGPQGRRNIGHPWVSSRLAERMDHLKGTRRKQAGRSFPGDLMHPRSELYWQE